MLKYMDMAGTGCLCQSAGCPHMWESLVGELEWSRGAVEPGGIDNCREEASCSSATSQSICCVSSARDHATRDISHPPAALHVFSGFGKLSLGLALAVAPRIDFRSWAEVIWPEIFIFFLD